MSEARKVVRPEWDADKIDPSMPIYSVGIASRLCKITDHTLRLYEQKGLVLPYRSRNNQRLYSQIDIERIQSIRRNITDDGLNIAGIKAQLALTPCWLIRPCALDDYTKCEAYTSTTEPCWAIEKKGASCTEEDCRMCPVYQLGNECHDIKAMYKNYLSKNETEES